jgi:hypothetical protein
MYMKFLSENLNRRDHLGDLIWEDNINIVFVKQHVKVWSGLNWFRLGCNSVFWNIVMIF